MMYKKEMNISLEGKMKISSFYYRSSKKSVTELEKFIEDIWSWAEREMKYLSARLTEMEDESLYLSYLADNALAWYGVKGLAMKNILISSLISSSSKEDDEAFAYSLEVLKKHGKRKSEAEVSFEDTENFIEWLLEIPYMVKSRLVNFDFLIKKQDFSSQKAEQNWDDKKEDPYYKHVQQETRHSERVSLFGLLCTNKLLT